MCSLQDWFDNASTKPLPGQHRLRDNSGRVITAVKAAEDRKLKETLEFTGMIGKDSKKRMAFKTVNRAVETVPLRTQEINTLTGERGPWKESSIQVDRVPDYSAATEDDERLIADRKRRFPTPKTIIVDGKKVKPSSKSIPKINRCKRQLRRVLRLGKGTTRTYGTTDRLSNHSLDRPEYIAR